MTATYTALLQFLPESEFLISSVGEFVTKFKQGRKMSQQASEAKAVHYGR